MNPQATEPSASAPSPSEFNLPLASLVNVPQVLRAAAKTGKEQLAGLIQRTVIQSAFLTIQATPWQELCGIEETPEEADESSDNVLMLTALMELHGTQTVVQYALPSYDPETIENALSAASVSQHLLAASTHDTSAEPVSPPVETSKPEPEPNSKLNPNSESNGDSVSPQSDQPGGDPDPC